MNRDDLNRFLTATPVNGRLALPLAIASHAARDLQGEISAVACDALELAWQWLEGEEVKASEMHPLFEHIVQCEMDIPADSPANIRTKDILATAGIALGIVIAQAYFVEVDGGTIALESVPGEMFEFADHRVVEVCEYAERVVGPDFDRLFRVFVENISRKVAGCTSAEPGLAIRRDEVGA